MSLSGDLRFRLGFTWRKAEPKPEMALKVVGGETGDSESSTSIGESRPSPPDLLRGEEVDEEVVVAADAAEETAAAADKRCCLIPGVKPSKVGARGVSIPGGEGLINPLKCGSLNGLTAPPPPPLLPLGLLLGLGLDPWAAWAACAAAARGARPLSLLRNIYSQCGK